MARPANLDHAEKVPAYQPRFSFLVKKATNVGLEVCDVRRHVKDIYADDATEALIEEYKLKVGVSSSKNRLSCGPHGNFSALLFPDAMPERFWIVSYISSLIFLHDDVTEVFDGDFVNRHHELLLEAIKTVGQEGNQVPSTVNSVSNVFYKLVKMEPGLGKAVANEYVGFLEKHKRGWKPFQSLHSYLKVRLDNSGAWVFVALVRYSMGIELTLLDKHELRCLEMMACEICCFVNDYYSYEKEKKDHAADYASMPNAIPILMRELELQEEDALNSLKDTIAGYKRDFIREAKETLCRVDELPLTPDGVRYVYALQLMVGGNTYFHETAPRYHVEAGASVKAE